MSRERGKILCHVANSALLVLTLAMSRGMANTDVAHAEGMGNPSVGVTTSSSDTYSHTTQEVIYREKVNQIRPIGNWDKYDYIGSPTSSRAVFIQRYVDAGSPLAKSAGDIFDLWVSMGLDPNWFYAVNKQETSLGVPPGSDYRMNPCNVRYASGVLPSYINVPITNGISDFSQATIYGKPITESQAYILAARVCGANLIKQHAIVIQEKGTEKIAEHTIWRETPPSENNTSLYWTSMKNDMMDANKLSIEENPPMRYSRRINIPLPQLPDSSTSPVNVAINKSVTPLPQPLAANITS